MGTLVVMVYPTNLFARLADHTYVACGTGAKGWGCWGGRQGGTELRRAMGSTARADAIAGANERGGISCYLINGVCHQAANRILFPAGITVRGARGYDVSEALFGTYGRPSGPLGLCRAPFDQHPGVSGDLAACAQPAGAPMPAKKLSPKVAAAQQQAAKAEHRYLRGVLGLYAKAEKAVQGKAPMMAAGGAPMPATLTGSEREGFETRLFMAKAQYQLGGAVDKALAGRLQHVRRSAGRSLMKVEDWFSNGELKPAEFARAVDEETVIFQETLANTVSAGQYKALLGGKPGDWVTLADPRIVKTAFKDL